MDTKNITEWHRGEDQRGVQWSERAFGANAFWTPGGAYYADGARAWIVRVEPRTGLHPDEVGWRWLGSRPYGVDATGTAGNVRTREEAEAEADRWLEARFGFHDTTTITKDEMVDFLLGSLAEDPEYKALYDDGALSEVLGSMSEEDLREMYAEYAEYK